jgi:hypothetical protein
MGLWRSDVAAVIIGAFLASKLGMPMIYPVFIRHVDRGKEMRIVTYDLGQILTLTARQLLVDDWPCEGRAMHYILDLIPKIVRPTTLVMFVSNGSEFKPDIVGSYVEEQEREILFPYDPL